MKPIVIQDEIHLVGVGCGGSYVAMNIAKRGVESIPRLHAWDGDTVDEHNPRSQTYLARHVGMKKVDALAEQVHEWGGIEVVRHPHHLEGAVALSGYVFLAVDSLDTRMQIWEQSIEHNPAVKYMIEMRLDTSYAVVHVVDVRKASQRKKWRHFWRPSDPAVVAQSCGTVVSRGPIAGLVASVCVWQMVRAAHIEAGEHDVLDNQIEISMAPFAVTTRRW